MPCCDVGRSGLRGLWCVCVCVCVSYILYTHILTDCEQATTSDNLYTWLARFYGGVSSAHGANRVFDDSQGPLRQLFWLGLFLAGFYAAILFSGSIVGDFLSKGVLTSLGTQEFDGELPQVTVCISIIYVYITYLNGYM